MHALGVGHFERGVGVWAQGLSQSLELGVERLARSRTAHGALEAHAGSDLFKLFAVLVLAIVHRMYQLVHQGVEYVEGVTQRRRDEDLVDLRIGADGGPALTNMAQAVACAGKAYRHLALGHHIALGSKEWTQRLHGSQQPGLAQCMVLNG